MSPLLSLCMPTNGIIEWVFPVLESIYSQKTDTSLFEVVITDNGKNDDFKQRMRAYLATHPNIAYHETDALPFLNEIESYKRASGKLIKFVNHRTLLLDGSLDYLIQFVKTHDEDRPVVYMSNGVLKMEKGQHEYDSFDQFVRHLSYWSSWSTGMTIWKEDFKKLPGDLSCYNELFPHTTVLFNERDRARYIIDNSVIFHEMPQGKTPKGNYDLFYAFGVEYPWIICTLLRDKDISSDTFRYVIDRNLGFIARQYDNFCVQGKYCSYDLGGLEDMFGVFYTRSQLMEKAAAIAYARAAKSVVTK